MNRNKAIVTAILLLLITVIVYYFAVPFFGDSDMNLENLKPDANLNSKDLVYSYSLNELQSNSSFNGKIIKVTGKVKEVSSLNKRNTVILFGKTKQSGIICDIHPSQVDKLKSIKINQEITIKGICKGFLKDVILLNCYIDTKIDD